MVPSQAVAEHQQPKPEAASNKPAKLDDQVHSAVSLIMTLTGASAGPRYTSLMPLDELAQCAGLAFFFVTKAGVVASVSAGKGFVIAKIPKSAPAATNTIGQSWSGPLFFDVKGLSLGLTLGYSEVDSCVVLDTQDAVNAFLRRFQATLDADVSLAAGSMAGVHMPDTAPNPPHRDLLNNSAEYSTCKGAIVDVSVKGASLTRQDDTTRLLYGQGTRPEDVLAGNVLRPDFVKPLTDLLNNIIESVTLEQQPAAGWQKAPPASSASGEMEEVAL